MKAKPTSNPTVATEGQFRSDVNAKIRQIILAERARQMVAETCIRVEARNGRVQFPGTDQFYATDQESVCVVATDDRLFKGFIEGTLPRLFKVLLQGDSKPSVESPRVS